MTSEITLLYVHGDMIGYARAGTYLAQELPKLGVSVYDSLGEPPSNLPIRTSDRKLSTSGYSAPDGPTNVVCWFSVPTHARWWWGGQHAAIFTMWEAMRLPESFRENLHQFDTVIVPSYQNLELFSRYHNNVHFVQLGVDPALWHPIPAKMPSQTFDFFINGRGSRKGIDVAYRAFRTVFQKTPSNRPVPRLVMKSMKGHGDYYGPDCVHVTGKLSSEEERDLYATAHCYLGPSRGEGFGLAPLQAMALGRPTILTAAHGHASFAHLGIPISATPKPAEYFIYGDAGDWWEPDFDELCEAMWDVYNDYETHLTRAVHSADEIAQDWTWANTAHAFVRVMGDEMAQPYTGSGVHYRPVGKQYKVILNQDWYGEQAGQPRYFEKGHLYYEDADIKRIFFDAGLLDPTCLDDSDHGLTPTQAAEIGLYSAAHSHCPTCGQKLGGSTRADEIYENLEKAASGTW